MRFFLFTIIHFLVFTISSAQTTFEFIGNGNWDDTEQWRDGLYPGSTIENGEDVTVGGIVTIPEGFTVIVTESNSLSFAPLNQGSPMLTSRRLSNYRT